MAPALGNASTEATAFTALGLHLRLTHIYSAWVRPSFHSPLHIRPLQGQTKKGIADRGRRAPKPCPCPRLLNFHPVGVQGPVRSGGW
jgi:hypothetical protein